MEKSFEKNVLFSEDDHSDLLSFCKMDSMYSVHYGSPPRSVKQWDKMLKRLLFIKNPTQKLSAR